MPWSQDSLLPNGFRRGSHLQCGIAHRETRIREKAAQDRGACAHYVIVGSNGVPGVGRESAPVSGPVAQLALCAAGFLFPAIAPVYLLLIWPIRVLEHSEQLPLS